MFNTIRDFLWVLQAFLRGKLLRQKAYRPQGNFFRPPVPVTIKRITRLMKWWGHRPMTLDEVKTLMEQAAKWDNPEVLYGGDWSEHYDFGHHLSRDDWDNSHRFIVVRRG